ncbi:MAG: nitrous oxide reductase accessory protein NosL [Sulfurospirillum sp.]
MKKILLFTFIIFLSHLFADFSKETTIKPELFQAGSEKKWCPITGLKIADFYKTSYIAKLKSNGRYRQYSSINALAIDMKESGLDADSIKALDTQKEEYINAKKAYFLINSTITPTFGKSATLAFKNQKDALKYKKKYGGDIVDFQKALHAATSGIKENISYMRKIYEKKLYIMGKKIYEKRCKKIDLSDFIEINELKAEVLKDKFCGNLDERHLQALALYLWDVKREGGISNKTQKVTVNEDEKCPVCGMFVYKYPRWAAQIFYKHGNHQHHLSFDGVKDMMKFYFNNKKWGKYDYAKRKNITKILVTDYYKQYAIDARGAFFVIGSNIYGPMGNELVPFSTLQEAKNFKNDHKGTKILKFSEIKESLPYKLDTK